MPTNGNFTVKMNGFYKPDLIIVDILGNIVFTKKAIEGSKSNVSNTFAKGLYIVNVQDQFHEKNKKIIIE